MKMMHKTLLATAVVGGLIGLTVYDSKKSESAKESTEQSLNMLQLKQDDIVKIEIRPRGGQVTQLEKKGDQWHLLQPVEDLADNQELRNFILSMNAEKTREIVVEGPETRLEVYGLVSPPYEVVLTDKAGTVEKIKIGSVKAYDQNLYAQINDEQKVRLVSSSWDIILAKRLAEFRNKNLYRASVGTQKNSQKNDQKPEAPVRLEIVQASPGYPAKMIFAKEKDQWSVIEGDKSYPLSNGRVDSYIENVKALRAQDFHAEDKNAAGVLSKFKLKNPAIEVRFFDEKNEYFKLAMSSPDHRGDAYAVSSDVEQVVSIFKMAAEPIYRRSDDFFAKKLPFVFKPEEAAKVVIATPELKGEFEKVDGKWTSKTGDAKKVGELLETLSRTEALRIFEPITQALKGAKSQILVSKADGSVLLDFHWGPERVEKAIGSRPEAKYILGKTEKSDRLLGLPERTLRGLNLASVAAPRGGE